MAILVLEHQAGETMGRLGASLADRGQRFEIRQIFAGDQIPTVESVNDYDGIIVLGGTMNVDQTTEHPWINDELALIRAAHEAEMPIVGLCLGCQLVAKALGGEVGPIKKDPETNPAGLEIGWHEIKMAFPGTVETIYAGLPWRQMQFHWHGCEVKKLPPGGMPLAGSKTCNIQAFKVGLRTFGFQYHFEVTPEHISKWSAQWADERQAAGLTPAQLNADTEAYFDNYQRLSTRLADSIADYLMPVGAC